MNYPRLRDLREDHDLVQKEVHHIFQSTNGFMVIMKQVKERYQQDLSLPLQNIIKHQPIIF